MSEPQPETGLLHRIPGADRRPIRLLVDGRPLTAYAGDTLLVALLAAGHRLRESEFGDGPRAGFCLMGACQDCWVTLTSGRRVQACATPAADGMSIITTGTTWLNRP
jgi:NADH dehydrogenase/NADH:ubiquinone oxidoreductase subunit G